MSLLTRCPACLTLFKVVPDQLRISEGWVRCGRCDQIFDASLYLSQESGDAFSGVPGSEPQAPEQPAAQAGSFDPPGEASTTQACGALHAVPEPEVPPDRVAESASPAGGGLAIEEAPQARSSPKETTEAGWRELSFIREARQEAFWRKPLTRVGMALLCCLLLGTLVGQILLHERDRLAALRPETRPWLLVLCNALDCSLSPLQQKESIVIDSATFNKVARDTYRLTFTVKNTAPIAVAVPSIELTLTASGDKPLLRRILHPSELGASSDTLSGGAEWPVSIGLTVDSRQLGESVAGYRLLAFYL